MKKILFKGCGTAISTPFDENGVNLKEFERLIEDQIQNKVDAIIVCGTTGESSTMTTEEKRLAIECAVKTSNGRVPIIAGTGGNNTKQVIENSKLAESLGVDGLLIVTPYYNKTSQRGLIDHYTYIADRVDIPMIIYNVPGRTGMNIAVDTVVELAKHRNIKAMKDATDNIAYAMDVLTHTKDLDFDMYSGCDDNILPFIAAGGKGVISVLSKLYPRKTEKFAQAVLHGDMDLARQMAYDFNDVSKYLFIDVNPIMPKAALKKMGVCGEMVRRPLIPTTEKNKQLLFDAMERFEKKGY